MIQQIIYVYTDLPIDDLRMSAGRAQFHFSFHKYMLPNTVSEKRQWDRCPTRSRIGHSKLTHGHYMSRDQP